MFKSLASMLRRKPGPDGPSGQPAAVRDETAPIFEGLAMTEELRDALFPKTPRMISAVFDRPAPLDRPPISVPQGSAPSSSGGFPIIF